MQIKLYNRHLTINPIRIEDSYEYSIVLIDIFYF